jgi:hypothetical protein
MRLHEPIEQASSNRNEEKTWLESGSGREDPSSEREREQEEVHTCNTSMRGEYCQAFSSVRILAKSRSLTFFRFQALRDRHTTVKR